ncbi:beta-glucosidase, partial [Peribacillus sp. NPDC056705]
MNYQFQNPDLPLEQRVNDLVSQFTLAEKIALMCQYQTEIPRLGVPQYKHGTEGAHGVAWLGEATVFPQNTGLACTWNPELMRSIGSVIADETRVYYQRNKAIH